MAAFLDVHLQKVLTSVLVAIPEVIRSLFEWPGPLASFSAKIQLAYAMRLVRDYEYRDLKCINKIRNAFAHDLHGLSFEDRRIETMCYALEWRKQQGLHEDMNARWMYQSTSYGIASALDNRTLSPKTERRIRARPLFRRP